MVISTKNIFFFIVFLIIIWTPFQLFIFEFDGARRIPFIMIVFAVLSLFINKNILYIQPVAVSFIWLIYTFINNVIKGYGHFESLYSMLNSIFIPLGVLMISIYCFTKYKKDFYKLLICALYTYVCISFLFDNFNSTERFGNEMNSNAIAIRSCFVVFFILLYHFDYGLNKSKIMLLCAFPILIIVLSASRMAFICLAIFCIYLILFARPVKFVYTIKKLLLLVILFSGFTFILNDTYLGERLSNSTNQIEGSHLETGTVWDFFGDRGYQYYEATPIIERNFVTGIGQRNFLDYTVTQHVFHSEYLTQLCECGFIGFVLYFSVFFWILRRLIRLRKKNNTYRLMIIIMLLYFFIAFVSRICYQPFYYCFLGLAIAEIVRNNNRSIKYN